MRPESPRNRDAQLSSAADRLAAIVEAAERAAESVIDDAEAEARRYLADAEVEADRLSDRRGAELARLVDSLLADAIALRNGAERMVESLHRAQDGLRPPVAQLGGEGGPTTLPGGEEAPTTPPLAPVAPLRPRPAESPATDRDVDQRGDGDPFEEARPANPTAGARLLATQLAVSGSSREEIDRRLRSGFALEDTSAILDAILGPEE
ncbi:MAG: hypothetical protein R2725_10815 [Solirubrobacterales bacterium]